MEKKKCSFKEHKDIDAVSYCYDCKVSICNKCKNYHLKIIRESSFI